MKSYLVGGAVRDKLLGLTLKDKDYVVVGSSPEQLLKLGFQQVGASFPVFLHPTNKQEYALARREQKNGNGYHGFSCYFGVDVTLEEDLERRDLTINAMAQDEVSQQIFDPFNGQQDLQQKILRHVSQAFVEDPLRVLRVARFYARFKYLGFKVATETMTLMAEIVKQGELLHLSTQRIYLETQKALDSHNPEAFFMLLIELNAFEQLFYPITNQLNDFNFIDFIAFIKQQKSYCISQKEQILTAVFDKFNAKTQQLKPILNRLTVDNHNQKIILANLQFYSLWQQLYQLESIEFNLELATKIILSLNQLGFYKDHTLTQITLEFTYLRLLFISQKSEKSVAVNVETILNWLNLSHKITAQDIIKQGFTGADISTNLNLQRAKILLDNFNNLNNINTLDKDKICE